MVSQDAENNEIRDKRNGDVRGPVGTGAPKAGSVAAQDVYVCHTNLTLVWFPFFSCIIVWSCLY